MASPLRAPLLLLAFLALASATTPKQGLRLMGGIQDADAQEQGVKDALDFAMTEYNKASNDAYHGRALQVLKARKQVSVRVVPQPSHGCGPLPPLRAPGQGVVCICWDLANACASPVLLTGDVLLLPCFSAISVFPYWFILKSRRVWRWVGTKPPSSYFQKSTELRH